jgi:hypothetical protein
MLTNNKDIINFYPKQLEAVKVIAANKHSLLEGGARSMKTMTNCAVLFARAFGVDNTDHIIFRWHFSDVKHSVCYQTINRQLSELSGIPFENYLNKSDWLYELPNRSRVWLAGTDDKKRVDKHLSKEFATIYICELSQINFDIYEMLSTRLNAQGIHTKFLADQNPPSINSWQYKVFHERKFPDGRDVPRNNYNSLKMNPMDNPTLGADYLDLLKNMSAQKRERFYYGNYTQDIGTLWKRGWFKYKSVLPEFVRIVVGVDPSGSTNGDEIGIVVAGKSFSGDFWILDDYTIHGTPDEWAKAVCAACEKWKADKIVAEKNFGGDMVESTIKTADKNLPVKLVWSSRGKIVRAEPISLLYERERVIHRERFISLEDEYCSYTGGEDEKSPNRLDAAVFALTELVSKGGRIIEDNAIGELQTAFVATNSL